MDKMAARMKQTWAVRNYLFSKYKEFKCLQIKRCRSIHESTLIGNDFKVEAKIGERPIEISTGQFARFADGAAVAKQGDTTVLVTAISKPSDSSPGFLPLTVDYRQKAAAAGRIPTNYLRRELGPSEKEILTSRLIDRSLRPVFPSWFEFETQIVCNLMAVDGENNPDILSINAASAALALSDIPWNGPVGAVRIGMIDGEYVINPTRLEQQKSVLDLVLTGTRRQKVVMMEASAKNIAVEDFRKAVTIAASEVQHIIANIMVLKRRHGKPSRQVHTFNTTNELFGAVKRLGFKKLTAVFQEHSHDKFSRDNAIRAVKREILSELQKQFPDYDYKLLSKAVEEATKIAFRRSVLKTGTRCDGRSFDSLRDISCKVNLFKPLHGSALFQRGQTQVMSTVTFDSFDSAAKVDTMSELVGGVKEKNFMLHYEFPSYATNEISRPGGSSRREIGHGALAEKGLRPIIPDNFPFTIRLTSEVLESNGSSSMASICGGSLALMDAGVPITEPAAGVAIGMMEDSNPKEQSSNRYAILTDILGIEDYMGDMDFKMAGTASGVTALQADIKIKVGLPLDVVQIAITKSRDAIKEILDIMDKTIQKPRDCLKKNGPKTEVLTVSMTERGKLIGTGGMNLKKLTSETGRPYSVIKDVVAQLCDVLVESRMDFPKVLLLPIQGLPLSVRVTSIDECNFQLFAHNQQSMDEAQEMIKKFLTEERAPELEFGAIYTGKIVEIREFGVMIQLHPRLEPVLCHTTQLDTRKVNHPAALGFKVGDEISVKYFGRDPANGRIRISRKVLQSPLSKARQFIQDDSS